MIKRMKLSRGSKLNRTRCLELMLLQQTNPLHRMGLKSSWAQAKVSLSIIVKILISTSMTTGCLISDAGSLRMKDSITRDKFKEQDLRLRQLKRH